MAPSLLRNREGTASTTTIELFFDLVYVFAVTQLSHRLLAHPSVGGALQGALLLAMVWLAWAYTTWVTNWLDPDRLPVRATLLVLMGVSLVLSAELPDAFGSRGLAVGVAYAVLQVGRTLFTIPTIGDPGLRRNFERILVWCTVSGVLVVTGGVVHGHGRELLWVLAVAVDLAGGAAGFWAPGLGRSRTSDWTIEGHHIADRCQAFVLIALGESVVVTGTSLSGLGRPAATNLVTFGASFAGAVLLWWVYFDRSAEAGARIIAESNDPGRLGRSAYHYIHPVMIAGIIVCAAADERVIADPVGHASTSTAWMLLGGVALFLAGHSLFKIVVWWRVPWTRLVTIALLALLGLWARDLAVWALTLIIGAIVTALVVSDRALNLGTDRPAERRRAASTAGA